MSAYFIYYASANLLGIVIFGIMLAHDRISIDKQEKRIILRPASHDQFQKAVLQSLSGVCP